ncbi:ferritin-like superfamily [Dichotomocladium elegans]|nr:ferritin-like superfamily [Dichotomocladium elegans]
MVSISIAKQNFATEAEDAVNHQIRVEQLARQQYLSAASYFGRADVALPGLERHFHEQVERQNERIQLLIDYLATRGGWVIIEDLDKPRSEYATANAAVEASLELEKQVNQSLLNLTYLAVNCKDSELKHHLKSRHLSSLVKEIEKVAKGLRQLQRCKGEGLGLYYFDQALYRNDGEFTIGKSSSD